MQSACWSSQAPGRCRFALPPSGSTGVRPARKSRRKPILICESCQFFPIFAALSTRRFLDEPVWSALSYIGNAHPWEPMLGRLVTRPNGGDILRVEPTSRRLFSSILTGRNIHQKREEQENQAHAKAYRLDSSRVKKEQHYSTIGEPVYRLSKSQMMVCSGPKVHLRNRILCNNPSRKLPKRDMLLNIHLLS